MKAFRFAALTLFAAGVAVAQAPEQYYGGQQQQMTSPEECPVDPSALPVHAPDAPLPVDPAAPVSPAQRGPKHVFSKIGLGAVIGGGVTSFFGDAATDLVKPGGSWTARLEIGTRSHLAGEVAYVGSLASLQGLGVQNNSVLMSNGAEGLLKWNILTGPVQPYLGAGAGWKNYRLQNVSSTYTAITAESNLAHIPGIAGVAVRARGFIFDARFTAAAPIDPDLIAGSNLVSWDASGRIGFEF